MFDPFGDFETAGYLRNVFTEKRLEIIQGLEHFQFRANLSSARIYLAGQKEITYKDFLKVHEIIFKPLYPWAGQDRSVTAPNIAITKAGYNDLFCHPQECKRAGEYALGLGNQADIFRQRSGEVLGLLAYSHPFLDGNGRAIMTVHSELCRRAGIHIDWSSTTKEDYLKALTAELNNPAKHHLDAYLNLVKRNPQSPGLLRGDC